MASRTGEIPSQTIVIEKASKISSHDRVPLLYEAQVPVNNQAIRIPFSLHHYPESSFYPTDLSAQLDKLYISSFGWSFGFIWVFWDSI